MRQRFIQDFVDRRHIHKLRLIGQSILHAVDASYLGGNHLLGNIDSHGLFRIGRRIGGALKGDLPSRERSQFTNKRAAWGWGGWLGKANEPTFPAEMARLSFQRTAGNSSTGSP